jgi:hypothetical protein
MRNLRQRLTGFVAATMFAMILGSVSPAFAADGLPTTMGGPGKDTCAFVAGKLYKVPPTSGAFVVFMAVMSILQCD